MDRYFVDTMTLDKPEPRHKVCWTHGMVSLQQRGKDDFAVRYGKQVEAGLAYGEACTQLGQALMHQMALCGFIDNREKREA